MGPISPARLHVSACLLSTCCIAAAAHASTVVNMNATRLARHAGQVIRADITVVESYFADNPKRIETRLTLSKIEYWKGGYDGAPDSFELVVPGGRVGAMQMRICCAPNFKVGQQWVLFLLPQYKTFPTVGLGQGSFLIKADETGTQNVYQEGFAGITSVSDVGDLQYAIYDQRPAHPHAAFNGLTVRAAQTTADNKLMTLAEFKLALQPILDRSHDYQMTQPAGKRIPVIYHPTSLKQTKDSATNGTTRGTTQGDAALPNVQAKKRAIDNNAKPAANSESTAEAESEPTVRAGDKPQSTNRRANGGK